MGDTSFAAVRLGGAPIVEPSMAGLGGERGANINGPSLIRVPEWIDGPLGRYYLYFAHHRGSDIRLAYADRLEGPWTVHRSGVLRLQDTVARDHIASPDVHVDGDRGQVRMYFHGCTPGDEREQASFVANSDDGLRFVALDHALAPPYLRVFVHDGWHYGIAKLRNESGILLRSEDGVSPFQAGPRIIPRMRHAAVLLEREIAWLFHSRIRDRPERLMVAALPLRGDWSTWQTRSSGVVLWPEHAYEGADRRARRSRAGRAWGRRHELRDPAVYIEGDRTFLLYSVAGEQGIALAELPRRS